VTLSQGRPSRQLPGSGRGTPQGRESAQASAGMDTTASAEQQQRRSPHGATLVAGPAGARSAATSGGGASTSSADVRSLLPTGSHGRRTGVVPLGTRADSRSAQAAGSSRNGGLVFRQPTFNMDTATLACLTFGQSLVFLTQWSKVDMLPERLKPFISAIWYLLSLVAVHLWPVQYRRHRCVCAAADGANCLLLPHVIKTVYASGLAKPYVDVCVSFWNASTW